MTRTYLLTYDPMSLNGGTSLRAGKSQEDRVWFSMPAHCVMRLPSRHSTVTEQADTLGITEQEVDREKEQSQP